jgi:hypothetical protein
MTVRKPDSAAKARGLLQAEPERSSPEALAAAQVLALLAVAEAVDRLTDSRDAAPDPKARGGK